MRHSAGMGLGTTKGKLLSLSSLPDWIASGSPRIYRERQAEVLVPPKIWERLLLISASFLSVRFSYVTDSIKNKRDTANSQEKGIAFLK